MSSSDCQYAILSSNIFGYTRRVIDWKYKFPLQIRLPMRANIAYRRRKCSYKQIKCIWVDTVFKNSLHQLEWKDEGTQLLNTVLHHKACKGVPSTTLSSPTIQTHISLKCHTNIQTQYKHTFLSIASRANKHASWMYTVSSMRISVRFYLQSI